MLLFAVLPWALRKTQRSGPIIIVQVIGFITTLSVLALSKSRFSLSTMMWFALMPLVALFAHGERAMRGVLLAALGAGTTCFVLLSNGISIG